MILKKYVYLCLLNIINYSPKLKKLRMEGFENKGRDEIFSRSVRAGRRTYFFDVKSTKKGDYYLTVTESKKVFDKDGGHHYEKHKLFLYKEDFDKFTEGYQEVIDFIKSANADNPQNQVIEKNETESFSNVDFDELDSNSDS